MIATRAGRRILQRLIPRTDSSTIPHVTVAEGRRVDNIDPGVSAHLPVQMVARHVELWRKQSSVGGGCPRDPSLQRSADRPGGRRTPGQLKDQGWSALVDQPEVGRCS